MKNISNLKTIVHINTVSFGSTGSIAKELCCLAQKEGFKSYLFVPKSKRNKLLASDNTKMFGISFMRRISSFLEKKTGLLGCFNFFNTFLLILKIRKYNPSILHIHNIHDSCINVRIISAFIKQKRINIIWTLHDCWAFTGRCPHFYILGCKKWKSGCFQCPYSKNEYPKVCIDRTKYLWALKKKCFTNIDNLTIVTPSRWLSDLVNESFLNSYKVVVINNGVDLNIFKPSPSNLREKYEITDKYILLGVSFGWNDKKGLDVFIELSKRLPANFQIILVGTDDTVDEKLPKNIISIHNTSNQSELAKFYTIADLFVNPTKEEVLGLVNIEALACGTPVITFRSGGSPECVDSTCGKVVEWNDIDSMEREIIKIYNEKPFSQSKCIERASLFDKNEKYRQYIELYKGLIKE